MPQIPIYLRQRTAGKGAGRVAAGGMATPLTGQGENMLAEGLNRVGQAFGRVAELDRKAEKKRERYNTQLKLSDASDRFVGRMGEGGDLYDADDDQFQIALGEYEKELNTITGETKLLDPEDAVLMRREQFLPTSAVAQRTLYGQRHKRRQLEAESGLKGLLDSTEDLETKTVEFETLKAGYGDVLPDAIWNDRWSAISERHPKLMAGVEEEQFYELAGKNPAKALEWISQTDGQGHYVNALNLSNKKRYALRDSAEVELNELERRERIARAEHQNKGLTHLEHLALNGATEVEFRQVMTGLQLDEENQNRALKLVRSYYKPPALADTKSATTQREFEMERAALKLLVDGGDATELNKQVKDTIDQQADGLITRGGGERVRKILNANRQRMGIVDTFIKARKEESWSRLEWAGTGKVNTLWDDHDVTDVELDVQIKPQLYRYVALLDKEPTEEELKTLTEQLLDQANGQKMFKKLMDDYLKTQDHLKSREKELNYQPGKRAQEAADDDLINSILK